MDTSIFRRRNMRKHAALTATALAAAVATIGTATAAHAGTNTSGLGDFAGMYNQGNYSSSTTDVTNKSWNHITNSSFTVHGAYGWEQVFKITEKQAKPADNFTVTGTVTVTTPYGTGTTVVPAFQIGTSPEVPWARLTGKQTILDVVDGAVTTALSAPSTTSSTTTTPAA